MALVKLKQIPKNEKPDHQQTGLSPQLALPVRGKTDRHKNSAQISPYMKLTQTTGPTLGGPTLETERKKEFNLESWEKDTSNNKF